MSAVLTEETEKGAFPAVLHCYTGGQALAHRAVALGLFVSFTGILTFKKSDDLRAIAKSLPADRILIETDAPYLAPGPYRGGQHLQDVFMFRPMFVDGELMPQPTWNADDLPSASPHS